MGILDKLKPTPRWKHADPAVRLEAVRELDDPIELAVLAETDSDARVRRAAIPRTTDPAVLGRVASADADPETRDRAADRLVALATAGGDDANAVTAVAMITDGRRLSAIAKGDASDAVRAEALARTTDVRALGSIARHAKHESTAAASLEKLTSRDELIDVAQNADHKDIALGAFERLLQPSVDLALVRAIETRTSQKAVARRARAIIADAEAAEAARLAAEEERQRREAGACDAIEHLTDVSDPDVARAELARLMQAFGALNVTDATLRDRAQSASARVEAAIAQRERDIREAAELARLRAESMATREALCERVETLDGDDVLAQLAPIEEEWRSLTPLVGDGPEAARLAERFAKAVAACRKRHELGALLAETRATYESLVSEAEALVSVEDTGAAMARWQSLSREARSHAHTLANALRSRRRSRRAPRCREPGAHGTRSGARRRAPRSVVARASSRRDHATAAADRAREARVRRGHDHAQRRRPPDERHRRGPRSGRQGSRARAKSTTPPTALRKLQEQVAPRVRELREMDDWRRFANAQRQEQLIAMAEAIVVSLKARGRTGQGLGSGRHVASAEGTARQLAGSRGSAAQRRAAAVGSLPRRRPISSARAASRTSRRCARNAAPISTRKPPSSPKPSRWRSRPIGRKTTARFQELQKAWQDSGPVPRDAGRDLGACGSARPRPRSSRAAARI